MFFPTETVGVRATMASVDDDQVIAVARAEGFELVERPIGGAWCWGFVREGDERYPAFGERRLAISYMRDWLRRGRTFE